MRILLGTFLIGLLGVSMQAQQRGMPRAGPAFPFDSSLPPVSPIPSLAGSRPAAQRFGQPIRRPGGRLYGGIPYWYPYATGYATGTESPQNVVVMQAASQPETAVAAEPIPAPKSDIRDYSWEAPGEVHSNVFSIALKSGGTEVAEAVWVQNGSLHYVTPHGDDRSVSLEKVDSERTERLNHENGLRLRIPPAQMK
ncbi:MAG: hypothetical protein ABFD89_09555 [Bryobacteraceae bacterium]